MDYWQYNIHCPAELSDIITAYLSDAAFDTFEESETGITAYLSDKESQPETEAILDNLKAEFAFTWDKTFIPGQNWNEIWESNFHPVIVGNFCGIRADFHEPIPDVQFELVINPKMAFGTGHHETTWQCIAAMEHLPIAGASIFDYGCGTGVLAIMASKLGATHIDAIDIEAESYHNTLENSQINHVDNVTALCGTLVDIPDQQYDGILANINRNVILDSLARLSELTKPGGWLLVSGILAQDEEVVVPAADAQHFDKISQTQRGNWLCIKFVRRK